MRLDQYLVQEGIFKSRSKAQEALKNKAVTVDGVIRKASFDVSDIPNIEITGFVNPYVSRSGLKLEKAIVDFKIDFKDKIVLDVGAATGGFTEVSLKYGAKKVYAVDVGKLQLVDKLKDDERVISYESTNILDVDDTFFTEGAPNLIVMDVSFVSITKILPSIKGFADKIVVLIKPQFESNGKFLHNGVIRDQKLVEVVVASVQKFIRDEGFTVKGITKSPIKGKEGNTEYVAYLIKK